MEFRGVPGTPCLCAVNREVLVFSGCNSHPATGSLQPVASVRRKTTLSSETEPAPAAQPLLLSEPAGRDNGSGLASLELADGRRINLELLEPGLRDAICDFLRAVGPVARQGHPALVPQWRIRPDGCYPRSSNIPGGSLDVIRNKGYNSRMMTYATLQSDRREFLALTGLTLQEFQLLLNAFTPAYERRYPKDRTLADRPRQRCAGGGRKGVLDCPEQKLLFLLVYLKTYPLQVLMGELFGLSQPGVNYWIHRLLPVLRDALDSLSVLPERNPNDFARSQTATGTEPRLIIDGTERRRQRPKSPEKQALHYSGKKKGAHR